MTTEQICKECGKVFFRSLYHPQITTCPECKGKKRKHCIYCKVSCKREGVLWCPLTKRDVTNSHQCKDFVEEKFTPAQRKEIRETLALTGDKGWI